MNQKSLAGGFRKGLFKKTGVGKFEVKFCIGSSVRGCWLNISIQVKNQASIFFMLMSPNIADGRRGRTFRDEGQMWG